MKKCDLHIHSIYSDGTCSPKELAILAKQTDLSAIALTDHNTIDGVELFLAECEREGIEGICGVEISSDYNGKELHIIALNYGKEHFEKIKEFLKIPKLRKQESNQNLADKLIENGYKIDYEKMKAECKGSLNRVHFARELINNGYIESIEQAFSTILSEKYGLYQPPKRFTAFEVIEFIKSINAISVLAHPLLNLSRQELLEFLPKAKKSGLDGMETMYSQYSKDDQDFCTRVAKEFGFKQSGGSDFHGENKPDIKMGVGLGNLKIPYQLVQNLKFNA